jgi:hypothetical protein
MERLSRFRIQFQVNKLRKENQAPNWRGGGKNDLNGRGPERKHSVSSKIAFTYAGVLLRTVIDQTSVCTGSLPSWDEIKDETVPSRRPQPLCLRRASWIACEERLPAGVRREGLRHKVFMKIGRQPCEVNEDNNAANRPVSAVHARTRNAFQIASGRYDTTDKIVLRRRSLV